MKTHCQACQNQLSTNTYSCVHECTFCEDCTKKHLFICPNCSGGLIKKPSSE
ncbi:DUF1272 domain-containing protein [Rossellomorea aquimaris]|uniref:DUF1272 domain-containing protein n=1 Tax=Rossellomorea aquimaris TaxID=189382 RepID=UPI0009ED4871|nr:DUF1272 domain-containing protein [Rossellomorea aquimaris]